VSGDRQKHFIVPVFIPNQGCPHRCIFCEQEKITSEKKGRVTASHVTRIIETALHSRKFDPARAEVAFYGGTFTSLKLRVIRELLGAVAPFLEKGMFAGVRVSTRPDSLDIEKLDLMKRAGVRTVELGVQSMDDHVLALSGRGHAAADSENGVGLLKNLGFQVGVQLMPGLPGDSREVFLSTVEKVIGLGPDMARLYPALVIRGTGLARMYEQGNYAPLGLFKAVDICAESCKMLEDAGICVIRIGLMSSPTLLLQGQILAGPWHAAFGFLVRCRMYQKVIESQLPSRGRMRKIRIRVRSRDVPLLRGYGNEGMRWISMMTGAEDVAVEGDRSLAPGRIEVSGS
jgi:histone acetyltransferase (RNA polymerase elongator complex component)